MSDLKNIIIDQASKGSAKYISISRRSFLKGALAVGGALALAGCGDAVTDTQTASTTAATTISAAETKTATVPATITVPETGAEIVNMVVMPSIILPVYEHCSGCKICMFECSIFHYGAPLLANSNIHVYCHDLHRGTVDIAILCMHCNDTPCLKACPEKVQAISIDEISGACIIDHEKCTLCGKCIEACQADRTGCLHLDGTGENVVGACDFCNCNPSCVTSCPEDALRLDKKNGDGKWWALQSATIAPYVYDTVFGDWYKHLETISRDKEVK